LFSRPFRSAPVLYRLLVSASPASTPWDYGEHAPKFHVKRPVSPISSLHSAKNDTRTGGRKIGSILWRRFLKRACVMGMFCSFSGRIVLDAALRSSSSSIGCEQWHPVNATGTIVVMGSATILRRQSERTLSFKNVRFDGCGVTDGSSRGVTGRRGRGTLCSVTNEI